MKKKSEAKEEQHPSLNGYVPSEPIPEGYRLKRLFNSGVSSISIELLEAIEDNVEVKKEEEKAA